MQRLMRYVFSAARRRCLIKSLTTSVTTTSYHHVKLGGRDGLEEQTLGAAQKVVIALRRYTRLVWMDGLSIAQFLNF